MQHSPIIYVQIFWYVETCTFSVSLNSRSFCEGLKNQGLNKSFIGSTVCQETTNVQYLYTQEHRKWVFILLFVLIVTFFPQLAMSLFIQVR